MLSSLARRSVAARSLLRVAASPVASARVTQARSISKLVEGSENVYAEPGHEKYKVLPYDEGNVANKAFSYFVIGTAGFSYAVAAKSTANDLLHSMNPSADVLAMANIEVDLSAIPEGDSVTLKWRGKPLFVRHRTAEEIDQALGDDAQDMRDPQPDSARVKKPEWLVLLGICTHLGCVPLNYQGDFKGFFCPCHGSHYDTSGRIRKGPAPLNLEVPPYAFLDDTKLIVGVDSV